MFSAVVSDAVVTVRGCTHTHTHTRISVRVGQRVASLWHNESFIKDNVFYPCTYTHIQSYTHTHTIIQILWHWWTHAFPLVKPATNTHPFLTDALTLTLKYRWQHPPSPSHVLLPSFPTVLPVFPADCVTTTYNVMFSKQNLLHVCYTRKNILMKEFLPDIIGNACVLDENTGTGLQLKMPQLNLNRYLCFK